MTEPRAVRDRIQSLDITRGVAVMGILSVNIVGMAMIQRAYFYPPADGFDGLADRLMWLVNFLFVDGKLRSLFSMMFGASTLLITERAIAAGRSPAKAHYARMLVLMLFGLAHYTLLWWGDILTHYALVGALAYLFYRLSWQKLLAIAVTGFLWFGLPSIYFSTVNIANWGAVAAGTATPEQVTRVEKAKLASFPDAATLAADRAEHATIGTRVAAAAKELPLGPFDLGALIIETLSLMLLGMALYKNGFLTGDWEDSAYRKVAWIGIGISLPVYAALAAFSWRHGFSPPYANAAYQGYSTLFRPIMATGYAALIILATRKRGWLSERIAAVGRTAFSNYLGCTLVGTLLFYGFAGDLYDKLSRAQAWTCVPPMWLLMLAWSKPWLDRFNYGPFEWAWRSLARWKVQPMRKALPAPAGD